MATAPLAPLTHATRNQVFTALFNLLQKYLPSPTGEQWRTFSQNLVIWDQVPAANQPALFLHRGIEIAEQKHAYGVTKWTYRVDLWIYFQTGGFKTANTYPDMLTDNFLDAVERLFQTDPLAGPQTLGGLVVNCWIDGTIATDPGLEDDQGVIVVPLSILI